MERWWKMDPNSVIAAAAGTPLETLFRHLGTDSAGSLLVFCNGFSRFNVFESFVQPMRLQSGMWEQFCLELKSIEEHQQFLLCTCPKSLSWGSSPFQNGRLTCKLQNETMQALHQVEILTFELGSMGKSVRIQSDSKEFLTNRWIFVLRCVRPPEACKAVKSGFHS